MTAIICNRLGFRYNLQWVLQNLSCEVHSSEFLGVIGPNGSGKTTLLKVMDGILKPQEGEVRINGVSVQKIKRNQLARTIAVVAQNFQMVFPLSVEEMVLMGRAPHSGKWRFEGETDFRIAREAMEMTDTIHLKDRSLSSLSGGEQQRVLIARALAQQPQILLLDEPTAFLDIKHSTDIFDLILFLNKTRALTVVAVTHDINLASQYCDRIMMMSRGQSHCLGSPEEVITYRNIHHVYEANVEIDQHPATGRPRLTPLGRSKRG
ncbi:MAG: ABC transporter ATP-binding protein [Syntrophaceae bacterium]|jgi:iron complex transport system ATP-binding protein|nr:ABC transporter ATP-binding protein [Syntrophaceae bacterium]HOC59636.1 ABC transporter ATP-binding protein [Smithellaceae bacterium]HQM45918.1 ABC transporter ATP-binding protein [Smithellaceae bacterium]